MITISNIQFTNHQSQAIDHINKLISLMAHDESQRTTVLYLKDARTQLIIAESRYAHNKQLSQQQNRAPEY